MEKVNSDSDRNEPNRVAGRAWWIAGLTFAILIAAYVGFRLPSLYSMTLYNIGITDGAWRRGIFGTVLSPLWEATQYRYGVMALVALGILALLLWTAIAATWRARWDGQRLLVIAWFISPAGAYLFHEIGYLDQFIYLLFFLSAYMVGRTAFIAPVIIMSFSVLVHELALFTTLPLFVLVSVLRGISARSLGFLALPVSTGLLLYFAPRMTEEQVGATGARLQEVLPFEIRWDAVALFGRSLSETWAMEFYSPSQGFLIVLPLLIVSTASTALVVFLLARRLETTVSLVRTHWAQILATGATAVPFFLVFLGWDFHRWAFLGLVNFAIVMYLWLSHTVKQPSLATVAILLLPLAMLFYTPLEYFDGYAPRTFTPDTFKRIGYSPHTEFLGFPDDRL